MREINRGDDEQCTKSSPAEMDTVVDVQLIESDCHHLTWEEQDNDMRAA